jgi:hypothetical protein
VDLLEQFMNDIVDYTPYMENDYKVYVCVLAVFDTDGNIKPVSFVWEDGNKYEIDRIIDIRRAASLKAGGAGLRYSVRVKSKQTYMYLEETKGAYRWFMERR